MLGHPVGDRVLSEIATPAARVLARRCHHRPVRRRRVHHRLRNRGPRAISSAWPTELLDEIVRPIGSTATGSRSPARWASPCMPEDGDDIDTLMQSADLALYRAKVDGRNQLQLLRSVDDPRPRPPPRDRGANCAWRSSARSCRSSSSRSSISRPAGSAASRRWCAGSIPRRANCKPDEFIPVAEETGVIITLGNWITAQAAKAAAQWPDDVTLCGQPLAAADQGPGRGAGHPDGAARGRPRRHRGWSSK